jgi:hypothetical protein
VEGAILALVCIVMFALGVGLLQIFARDLMWELTQWSNQIAGRASERTDTWDTWQIISGVLLILFGLGFAAWALSMNAQANAQNIQLTAFYETIEANQATLTSTLDTEFAEVIPALQRQAKLQSQRVRATELGLDFPRATELEYGFCDSDETFYVYILNYRGQGEDYAYLPRSDPSYCRPPNWYFVDVWQLGTSTLGGTWYELDFGLGFGRPATSTPGRAITRTPTLAS